MIHKRILDEAAANPRASVEELADDVSGASVQLVERVLDEYGDPSEPDEPHREAEPEDEQESDDGQLTKPEELADGQRAVLEAVRRDPDATQAELAERLGVSASTVNRRLHKIDGFDWADRRRIAREVVPAGASGATVASDGGSADTSVDPASNGDDDRTGTEVLRGRLDRLERQLQQATGAASVPFEDRELAAKVVRACMASDAISEDEELRVIEAVIATPDRE